MGLRIFTITAASLIMLGFIDAFIGWYKQFLDRRLIIPGTRQLFIRLIWVILAILFWLHLYYRHMPESFDMSHFLFASFIYSIKGLITSFTKSGA